jgi:hypothetical protein
MADYDATDIPPDFLKGQKHLYVPRNVITTLELAFLIQDPCGLEAIELARGLLNLIRNREDNDICKSLIHEIQRLNKLYPR